MSYDYDTVVIIVLFTGSVPGSIYHDPNISIDLTFTQDLTPMVEITFEVGATVGGCFLLFIVCREITLLLRTSF